jgi:hypothetical protein
MTTAKAAMAVLSFNERLARARKLVSEGHRLMDTMHRDIDAGAVMVRDTRNLLSDLNKRTYERQLAK